MTILVIGHWASCNLGDRYQPFVVYNALRQHYKESEILPVNFSGTIADKLWFSVGSLNLRIATPPEIAECERVDAAIITTGSMDSGSPYVGWLSEMLAARSELRQLIVWGGFSRGYQPFEVWRRGLEFLSDPRVLALARDAIDLDLYRALGCVRASLGGDPIAWWSSAAADSLLSVCGVRRRARTASAAPTATTVLICSVHCFEYDRGAFWNKVKSSTDCVLCIDSHADARLPGTVCVPAPWELLDEIAGAKHVISARLHGGVLAACSGVPTTLAAVDQPESGHGSLKFEAVATTALGHGAPIARLLVPSLKLSLEEVLAAPEDSAEMHANAKLYVELTQRSLERICDIVRSG